MKRALAALAAIAAVGVTTSAHADDDAGPRNAISVHPFSITSHGLALQYERYIAPRHWSLALGVGFRWSSRGDFSSFTTSAGIEPRYWLWGPDRSASLGSDSMIGPYVSLRTDVSWLTMSDTTRDRWVGGNVGVEVVGSLGWRFHVGRVEITPSIGGGTRTDFDTAGRLAPWTVPLVRFDWTVGVMF